MGSPASSHCVTALVYICWSLVSFPFPTGAAASPQVFVFYTDWGAGSSRGSAVLQGWLELHRL